MTRNELEQEIFDMIANETGSATVADDIIKDIMDLIDKYTESK